MKQKTTDGSRIEVPPHLQVQMVAVARAYRKAPTRSEKRLWAVLRNRDSVKAKFRRQHPIGPFVVDFYCSEQRLIVEVDGPIHESQQEHDLARQQLLEACGYQVFRVTSHDVETQLPTVLKTINDTITLRMGPLSP